MDDNSQLQSTSCFSSCFTHLVKGSTLTSANTILAFSLQVNPLSANTKSLETCAIPSYLAIYIYQYNSYQVGDAAVDHMSLLSPYHSFCHQHTLKQMSLSQGLPYKAVERCSTALLFQKSL